MIVFRCHSLLCCLGLLAILAPGQLPAQDRYLPLDHRAPTGTAGRWSALTHPGIAGAPQPVRVQLPSSGTVTFYQGSPQHQVPMAAPAQVGMGVGYVYRFRISDLPEFPGVDLYPTVEILDRLHPPANLAQQFPVPIEISEEEIEIALQERMVTKVIYLEHPDRAFPIGQEGTIRVEQLKPNENLLEAADQRGRPMAILRLGGRIPDPRSPNDEFFSQSPLMLTAP